MNKVLKFLLYFLALTFLALVCWGVTLYFYWPAWTTPAFFFGTLAALWLGRWLKRWVLVYRSKRQIAQAVAQTQMPAPAPSSAMSLEEQWEEAVRTLKQSNLKRLGDPLYILPWYLVLGAPGSGRSAMLRQARSASPLKDIIQTGEVSGEGRGEWWYLNNAVVIEPAGSYALPQNEAQDREEWEKLLTLLGKYRKKEPLNGLIVTIAADRLLTAGPEALAEEGRFIRKRVDQLMRLLDIKFPVYVMVTKCDVLYGFEDWSRHLPDRTLEQTMGQIGGDELAEGKAFLDRTFDSIVERLKDLRLVVAHRLGGMNLRLLLLPQEFERLKPGLDAFWTGGFCSDPYLDSPFLRGLLFCSSQQQPSLPSLALKEQGVETAPAAPVGPARGLFLRDFFQIVLPEDRGYFKPLGYGLQWQQLTQKVGLAIWLLVGLIAFAALTISFGYSVTTMNRLREDYPGARTFTGKFQPDLETMAKYIPMLKQMEERDEQWFIRLVPFNQQVMQLEADLQDAFANDFRRVLLTDMDDVIARQLDALSAQDPQNLRPLFLQLIVRRINLIKARLKGQGLENLAQMPSPFGDVVTIAHVTHPEARVTPEDMQAFAYLYAAYVAWEAEEEQLDQELATLQGWLDHYVLNVSGLNWLTAWVNQRAGLPPVTLKDFWRGSRSLTDPAAIPPAFTSEGKTVMDRFLGELEAAESDPGSLADARAVLENWYLTEKAKAWYLFLRNFDQGKQLLAGELEWKVMMEKMTGEHSPYYGLLARLDREFGGYRDDSKLPEWIKLARRLAAVRPSTTKPSLLDKAATVTGIVNRAGGDMIRQSLAGGPGKGKELFDNQLNAAKVFQAYQSALDQVWKEAVSGEGRAYKIASDFHSFSVDPSVKASPMHAAHDALGTMKTLLGTREDFESRAVWSLMEGPLQFFLEFVDEEAACVLQKEWEAKVLFPTQGAASTADLYDLLYGAKGAVWSFAEGLAKPFVLRNAQNYRFVETLGHRLPFTGTFLPFMNDSLNRVVEQKVETKAVEVEQKQLKLESTQKLAAAEQALGDLKGSMDQLKQALATVTIKGLPTEVNAGAQANPFATILSIECIAGVRTIPNYNFPVVDTFKWSPMTCGDTTLQIKLEDATLVKRYAGAKGFAHFLQDFYDGEHSFGPADFPMQRQRLELLGVKAIRVRYEITGHETILDQTRKLEQLEQQEKRRQEAKRALQAQQDKIEEQSIEEVERELSHKTLTSATIAGMIKDLDQSLAEVKGALELLENKTTAVTISGLPTSINPDAKVNPSSTLLTVQCAAGIRTVPNYNFPVVEAFQWSPNTCGDTTLQVTLDGLTLTRKYAGPSGFGRFLQDFYAGDHLFTPADFPLQKQRLELLNVKNLRVRYEIAGQEAILELIRQSDRLEQQQRRREELRALLEDQRDRLAEQEVKDRQKELRQKPQIKVAVPARIAACWDGAEGAPKGGMQTAAAEAPSGSSAAAPAAPAPAVLAAGFPPAAQVPVTVALDGPAPDGPYAIQVGAFLSEGNAEAFRKSLEVKGYTTMILVERDGRQRQWFTVLIGWDMDRPRAYQAAEDYKAMEELPAIVRELLAS